MAVADPLALLSFVAGVTDRIVLGTAVLLLPYRTRLYLPNSWQRSTSCRGDGCR